ncbi:MAG: transcriptional regulator [Xanthomonadales bacterium]|nr:transcriptional regulator [Xanthomonadales bacterium]MCC6596663.1 TfoX/Sxy family protein [Rhodanobacteraceae bacterium]MDL1869038.1 TfoX/Sxy family protein [Gammaproteobacteria bacterium PRO6]
MAANDNKIRNVGPKSAAWLRQVGVRTTEDLVRVGVVEAFLKVKRAGFRPSLNLLYSMAGALADCHWNDVPEAQRKELVAALEAAESANPIRTRWERQKAASDGSASATGEESGDDAAAASLFDEPDRDEGERGGGDRDLSRFD